jgi:hypothetical protein
MNSSLSDAIITISQHQPASRSNIIQSFAPWNERTVYVPQGTFAASKDEMTNGPTWTSNIYIIHTHTTHKLEHLKQCAGAKSDLTTKHCILKIEAMLMAMFPVLLAAICKWVEDLSRPSTEIFEQLFLLFSITWAISFDRPKNGKLNRVKRHPNPRPK